MRIPGPLVAHHDLDDPETDTVRLLFHIKRLLDRVLAGAAARHEALAELTLHLQLDHADAQTERIRPAAPTLDVVQIMNLVRLRMEALALARKSHRFTKRGRGDGGSGKANASQGAQAYLPVRRAPWPRSTRPMPTKLAQQAEARSDPRPQPGIGEICGLEAGITAVCVTGRSTRVAAAQQGLFVERPSRDRAAAERALARVRAEFGDEAVVRARLVEAHLPEARFAWEPAGTVPAPVPREVACPPMVRRIHARAPALELHPEPGGRLVHGSEAGTVRELAGPYHVSGGWWHSAVHREYYFARMRDGDMLWLYYDRMRRRWRRQGRVE